jgi:hypothetical protein
MLAELTNFTYTVHVLGINKELNLTCHLESPEVTPVFQVTINTASGEFNIVTDGDVVWRNGRYVPASTIWSRGVHHDNLNALKRLQDISRAVSPLDRAFVIDLIRSAVDREDLQPFAD